MYNVTPAGTQLLKQRRTNVEMTLFLRFVPDGRVLLWYYFF